MMDAKFVTLSGGSGLNSPIWHPESNDKPRPHGLRDLNIHEKTKNGPLHRSYAMQHGINLIKYTGGRKGVVNPH